LVPLKPIPIWIERRCDFANSTRRLPEAILKWRRILGEFEMNLQIGMAGIASAA
jgi:hypothetical protein